MTTNNVDWYHDTVREGVKSWMKSIRSTAASASSSLSSHHFLVKISSHALVLKLLLSSSCNSNEIITMTSIPILPFLCICQSFLYLQKLCRHKQDYTRPRLRNTVAFGSGNDIEGLISPKSSLYDCSHAAVRLGHLTLGYILLLICHHFGGCEVGGWVMNASLPYVQTVLQILTVSLLDSWSYYLQYSVSSNAHKRLHQHQYRHRHLQYHLHYPQTSLQCLCFYFILENKDWNKNDYEITDSFFIFYFKNARMELLKIRKKGVCNFIIIFVSILIRCT